MYSIDQEQVKKKYSTVDYAVLKKLDLTPTQLVYLDMVYYLSRSGWCYKSLSSIASDMNIGKTTVVNIRDKMIDKKLIVRNDKGHVKTTMKYHLSQSENNSGSVRNMNDDNNYRSDIEQTVRNRVPNRSDLGTKNNNRNTLENNVNKNSEKIDHRGEYSPTLERLREQIKNSGIKSLA